MDRRYEARLQEMLAHAEVSAEMLQGLLARLDEFVVPFAALLQEPEQRRHTVEYLTGLLSKLKHKTSEGIAYLLDQERQGLQKFVGHVPWDHQPLLALLACQVGAELGEPDGVLVFDPSGFPKKGDKSVGVARQWCGRLGKVENCQVGVYLAYVSRKEQALVSLRLYLPKEWNRRRCRAAGVPKHIKNCTRHELALQQLDECGEQLPHTWVAGDDEMGRSSKFRQELRNRQQRYLLAVPSNTLIRDADAKPPKYSGRGRHPKSPFVRVARWCAALPEDAWVKITVRDGEKGPLTVEAVKRSVQARTETKGTGPDELLFITRERQADGTFKLDYYLSNAEPDLPLAELARVAKAAHRVEECFKRGKGEAGLADYQVRNWMAWHHHQTLSLLAAWFLNQETRRGKNTDPRADHAANAAPYRRSDRETTQLKFSGCPLSSQHALAATQRAGTISSPSRT
jgi:SRSO17 transposase